MEKKRQVSKIDFADSDFISFNFKDDTLIVYVKSWNDKIITITFINVIRLSYQLGDLMSGVYEITEESLFLKEALSREYVQIPLEHSFKLFHLEDISDFPFFQVVAETININNF